jgi:hypothetical protein
MTPSAFSSATLEAGTAFIAVLFGVFGFLYSVYCAYSHLVTPEHPIRPPVVAHLRRICRLVAVLMAASAGIVLPMIFHLQPNGWIEIAVGILLAVVTVAIGGLAVWIAFRMME